MPFIFSYLLKLSLGLSVVYLFYQFVLRRLTFYNWNRFYLLCYTVLSFFIPFINITTMLEENEMMNNKVVQLIPQVGSFNGNSSVVKSAIAGWTTWHYVLLILFAGVIVMLIRLLVQLLSFKNIMNKAQLLSNNEVKLYQVNRSIIPFSFGNSIFINQQLHNDKELQEIIRHEFVHVRQKHTLDIIWTEVLCILNWYNPLVWMIRKAIRQNLEFIADNKVLQTGFDKKQYQYLLLKVTGNNHFSIASQFNFSSLKKRIAMMNKMKSAKAHLIKFLFVLPLIAVLILSFRNKTSDAISIIKEKVFNLSGIVYDNKTELPLSDVTMIEPASGIKTTTDGNGFYQMTIPITAKEKQDFTIKFLKDGYIDNDRQIELDTYANRSCLGFFSLLSNSNYGEKINHVIFFSTKDNKGNAIANPGYAFVKDRFENYFKQRIEDPSFYEKRIYSLEDVKIDVVPYSGTDTIPDQGSVNSKGYFINIDGEKGNCIVVVKDKNQKEVKRLLLTDWNKKSNYYQFMYGALPVDPKDANVINPDKVPVTYEVADQPAIKDFKRLELNDDLLATITFTDGKIEKYDLNKEADKKEFEKKYGPVISALPKGDMKPVTIVRSSVSYSAPEKIGVSSSPAKIGVSTTASTKKSADLYIGTAENSPAVEIIDEFAEPVSSVKVFDNINGELLLDIKGNTPGEKVKEMASVLKSKGYEVTINVLEYHNGRIASLKGTISDGIRKNNFDASDFLRFAISDVKKEDGKKEFNFYVGNGNLTWQ